ncbi:MAG: hypothetical protein B6I35_01315 [Anaerolineaceae bacterium 4572_32.2]|nr:MAG: hypothetical protein B6I35_01315 [Anaerolineaceae bacterium 4572_32.2]HEY72959.1 tetratricopeptide repeat protein [Thermoflexia bacterium]
MSKQYDPPSATKLVTALRNYLPSSLERQCLLAGEITKPQLCAQHLYALLQTISTYLPRQVVIPLLSSPTIGKVEGNFVSGTMMFADISGFTAMSEKLSRLGKEGAEEITAIVNRFFAALLKVTDQYGGDLLKFGGDALLLFFGGEAHALHASQAALQMQASMSQFSETVTSQGPFKLQMTIGLGTGPLFMANLGSEENLEFTVMGRTMAHMARAEDLASAGEIFIDAETRRILADRASTDKAQDGYHRLVALQERGLDTISQESLTALASPPPVADDELQPWLLNTVQCIQALELFLPPGLIDKIKLEPERVAIGGEYRPVTVLFANFYGVEEIIKQLGKARTAEITAILNAHFTTMERIIARYGGVVNKVDSYAVGHRIMALFGAPRAHIDDPERAVRAALEMQAAMVAFAELDTSCGAFSLKQRIGINTGLVFAGNVGSSIRQEYSVMGDEVNLTARLMAVAAEGQVLLSQSTARQSGGVFLLHEQEDVQVKGKSLPVHNYEVLGLQERRTRERRPLIGRDEEWQTIRQLTDRSLDGQTQVLTIVGDVGLGKSRLLEELMAYWADQGALGLIVACPSFGRHTPYLPWLDLLRDLFGFNPADSTPVKLEKIKTLLQEIAPEWRDWTTLIAQLLSLDVEASDMVRALDAETRQRTILRVMTGLVEHVSGERPLLLAIDDLQWADDVSIKLVNHVARRVVERPLLLALAHRPEESLELNVTELPHHTNLDLTELSNEAGLQLLDTLLPTTPQMPERLKRLILDKAHGNPLFIGEVAHSLIENYLTLDEKTGDYHAQIDPSTGLRTSLEQIEIPDSVNRVIMSRIDRLDESSRNMLRVASAIGQEFKHWLLQAIYPYRWVKGELRERLDQLSRRDILEGPHPESLYLFRHILTREVAYESLLYADRRALHRRIGESIETQQADRLAEYDEVLAHHFGLAEEWEKALSYHLQAGRKAQNIYASKDAAHHFRQALKAAEQTPGSERQQLTAHEGLSDVLDTLGDYDKALGHIQQARDLVTETGFSVKDETCRRADLYRKTASIYEKKSNYETAFEWLHKGLELVEGMGVIEAARIYLLGSGVYRRLGKNKQAIVWCKKSLDTATQVKTHEGQQSMAHAYYNLGGIYTRQGDLSRAIQYCYQSLQIYQQIDDIVGQSQAHINLGNCYFDQGDWPQATEHYLQALKIKRKIGDVYGQAFVTVNLGGVYRDQGDLEQAANYYQQSLEMWQELGSIYVIGLLHNNIGDVALRRGEPKEALSLLQKSLHLFRGIESTDFLPEVYRHLAQAYLGCDDFDQALEQAQRSLALAQEQEMRLEEGATRRVLGQVYLARRELTAAEQELEKSLQILEGLDSRYEVGQTLFQSSLLYRRQERPAEADTALNRAIAIFEELGALLDLEQASSRQQMS